MELGKAYAEVGEEIAYKVKNFILPESRNKNFIKSHLP
jgi:hypothetical protein